MPSTLESFFSLVTLSRLTSQLVTRGHHWVAILFFFIQHLINQCMLINFYHSLVTKVFNIQHVHYLWLKYFEQEFLFSCTFTFTFKFMILVSHFTRKDNGLFCLNLHLSLFKTKTKINLGLQQLIDKIDYYRQRFPLWISRVCPQCTSNFSRLLKWQHLITHFYGQN